ncbi:MAG: cupin domain-containing protein [Ruminococcaceae bacterium]|nr:cupin domain-containing protein [Oscillospiraceae bacterium]
MESNVSVGQRIRHYRQLQGLTVKTLAERVGITASMLSQVERDLSNPSLKTLRTIAAELDIPLIRLFMAPTGEQPKDMVHREERRHIIVGGVDYELLTPDTSGAISMYTLYLQPGCSSVDSAMAHQGEEVAVVLDGELVLELEDNQIDFRAGDSIRIPAMAKHAWYNKGDKAAQIMFAIAFPGM